MQSVWSLQGGNPRISFSVVCIQKIALPFVLTGLDSSAHNHCADLALAALILHRDDLAAELSATVVEVDLRAGRRTHPNAIRIAGTRDIRKTGGEQDEDDGFAQL